MNTFRTLLGFFAMTCASLSTVGWAGAETNDYRVAAGETIEVSFSSIPDFKLKSVVEPDGNLVLPDVGPVPVAGLTALELRSRMELVLSTKVFHLSGKGGEIGTAIFKPNEISTSVVSYMPVYVTGDVLSPGEQQYRPQLTARQAVAAAGGESKLRIANNKSQKAPPIPVPAVVDKPNNEVLWSDYMKQYFLIARTQAALNGQSEFKVNPPQSPLDPKLIATIAQSEAKMLSIATEEKNRAREHLEKAVASAAQQVESLTQSEQVAADTLKGDQRDLDKMINFYKSGNITNDRIADLRRAVYLSSTHWLETLIELRRTRDSKAGLERDIEKADNLWKLGLLDDLKNATVRLADLEVKIRQTGEPVETPKIVEQAEEQVVNQGPAVVSIMRKSSGQWQTISSSIDREVLPGDIVVVTLAGS